MKRFFLLALIGLSVATVSAQRVTDKLDRGLVAVPSGSGSFVSWRIFGEEYYDTEYNLYRNGVKVNAQPLRVSNYVDAGGSAGAKYQVAAVVRGVEQAKSAEVTRLGQQYLQFAVKPITDRNGKDITADCTINDIALADVDGDGVSEFIMKRNYADGSSVANTTAFNHIECYNIKGDRLWYIDLGPNMVSGPDEQYDAVGFDWDGDGKAEILMRGADNMIIHHADGTTTEIGNMSVNTRGSVLQTANMTYTNQGAEYLLYLEGATGKPYAIGPNDQLWMSYPLPRGTADDWGDGYGHRATKHYFGAPCLDGRHPFIFLGRGCYTKHIMKAFSVDPASHKLTQYWSWQSGNSWSDPWFGNGYHNFGIADVDWDGRDEICFGSMVIDDNGKGLSTSGLGHGDAQHCGDFDPYRHGQEIFACNEDEPAMNYRDATTSKIYYRLQSTSDDGRALCGNFSNQYPGAIGHSSQSGTISCVSDKVISGGPTGFTNNFRIYWDGDLLEEGLDGRGTEGVCAVYKADGSTVFQTEGTKNCNWTKNTPSATGDILGDWREEIIVRTADNRSVRIYTTSIPTQYRNYTLWHDHQYRQGMVWESVGYNQPPHASYFIGELEGITVAPPPLTMTGRTEVVSGGTIDASLNDQHLLICETGNTSIIVADGAKPYMVTFNVPSWVQGTNSNVTTGNPAINYTYYSCDVSGAPFSGPMRLVKQGDGTLNLPKADMTYTGETSIWAGTVNFDGQLKSSPLWMNRFTQLNSDGGLFRSITMEYDATLRPGRADHRGTITTDSLRLGIGSRVVFDLYCADLTADEVNTKFMSIDKKTWSYGPKYLIPVFEFVVHDATDGDLTEGRYLIGTVETLEGSLDDIRIEGTGGRKKTSLLLEDGKLYLQVSGTRDAATVVWNGLGSSNWELAGEPNFTSAADATMTHDIFVTGDKVVFDDTASQFGITLKGDLEPDTVEVNSSSAYSFGGTGALVGSTVLVKRGSGTLTINTDNSYTGGTRLSGGVVAVRSLSNANQPRGNLGGVATSAGKFIMENGAELRTTAAVTQGSPMQMMSDEGGVVNNQHDFIIDRTVSGTRLTKRGAGWMKLNTSNTSLNRLVVAAGTVQCINAAMPARTVEYQGGTLLENTSSSYNIYIPQGKEGTWNMANRSTYTNRITGSGTLNANCVTEKGSNYYATRTPVECNLSDFEGTLVPSSSLDDPSVLRFTMNMSGGMPKGIMKIPANVEVQNSGRTYHIGRVSGTGKLGGSCTFSNGVSVGANTWQVGNDSDWPTSAAVTSNANLVKVGKGKVTWNGINDNSGTTTISEGEISVVSGRLGTGRLIISEGAVLSGSIISSRQLANSSVTVDGTLCPGLLATSASGTLRFGGKNVTISQTGRLVIRAASNGRSTALSDIARLTVNGTIAIEPIEGHALQVGDEIRLWPETVTLDGTPQYDMLGGITWDTSRISQGILVVQGIDTGISPALADTDPCNVYDLQGRLVRRQTTPTSTEGLPAGIYLRSGRKVVVR